MPNEVKVVTKSHLTHTFESEPWGATIANVLNDYQLNEEQEEHTTLWPTIPAVKIQIN